MKWAELVLQYVQALIWPSVTVALALVFRSQLRNLIDGVSEVTAPGNISFKRRVTSVKADAEDASDATFTAVGGKTEGAFRANRVHASDGDLDQYREMSHADPLGAIAGAWRVIRTVVRDVTRALGTDRELGPGATTTSHVRTLVPLGLSEEMVTVARELSGLRNDVVHGRRVRTDAGTASDYLAASEDLLAAVRAVRDSGVTKSTDTGEVTEGN